VAYLYKSKDNGWITKGIKISCRRKRSLYILNKNYNNPKLKLYYKHYSAILRKVIRMAKKIYFSNLIKTSKNKTKMTWNIINNVIRTAQTPYPTNPFFKAGHDEIPCNDVVEVLNDYFLNVTETIKTKTHTRNSTTLLSQTHQ
jgi:hypothetical protein